MAQEVSPGPRELRRLLGKRRGETLQAVSSPVFLPGGQWAVAVSVTRRKAMPVLRLYRVAWTRGRWAASRGVEVARHTGRKIQLGDTPGCPAVAFRAQIAAADIDHDNCAELKVTFTAVCWPDSGVSSELSPTWVQLWNVSPKMTPAGARILMVNNLEHPLGPTITGSLDTVDLNRDGFPDLRVKYRAFDYSCAQGVSWSSRWETRHTYDPKRDRYNAPVETKRRVSRREEKAPP